MVKRYNSSTGKVEDVVTTQGYDPSDDMMKVKSLQKKWKTDFAGTSLNTDRWEIVQQGAGHTVSVANGELTIGTGTTANSETILLSKEIFTDPVRALFGFMLSQKIANQEFYMEFVSVDPKTGRPDNLNKAAWKIAYADSSTNDYAVYQVQAMGIPVLSSGSVKTNVAQTAYGIYEIEMFSDEVWFHARGMDSSNGRAYSNVRHQNIPHPTSVYKVQLRAKNLATAPASNTNFKFQFVNVIDYAELTAEITAGRGNVATGQSIATQVVNSPTVIGRMDANNTPYTDTTTNLAANATYTGTSRDAGSSYQAFSRFRATVAHTAALTPGHLVFEQSTDGTTFRETHRIPIPSDGQYRTFDFPFNLRYGRIKFINGATAQTLFFLATTLIRSDGGTDSDKTITFTNTTTALGASATFTGVTLNLGPNHSVNRHRAMVFADQAGTLYLEQSRDGTTWRITDSVAVTANTPTRLEGMIVSQYQRVRYANGATANTSFELVSALVRS